ncbi:MAG TPA: hypothetical protein VH157_14305, partial [Bryobacteraceae bacterium]|nr:hypothetical protein [Bryobacteraceae bacterium]
MIWIASIFYGLVAAAWALAASAGPGCLAVSSDRILVRDVRGVLPFLQNLDPETAIGFAPRPGVQRTFSAKDLITLAQKYGLDPGDGIVPGICVERVVRPISLEEMRVALL